MLNQRTPLEETRASQSIFAKGEAKAEVKGKSESLQRLLYRRFTSLPGWATERIAAVPGLAFCLAPDERLAKQHDGRSCLAICDQSS